MRTTFGSKRSIFSVKVIVLLTFILTVFLALSACPVQNEPISVELRPSKLVIFNNTTAILNFAVMER